MSWESLNHDLALKEKIDSRFSIGTLFLLKGIDF